MKGPRRLLHDDPGFRRLVDAMRNDGPSEAQMTKALSTAAEIAALPPSGGAASWLGRTSVRIGLTMAVAAAGLVGASVATSGESRERAAASAPSLPASPPAIVTAAPEPPLASVRVDDLPSAPVASTQPAVQSSARAKALEPVPAESAGRAGAASPNGRGTFAEELALTSEARAALERGDISSCLGAVERYQRSFRGGIFAQEIDVIRIEALAKSGARERAHSAAEQFLRANATSPYEDRVRSVLENTK